MYIIGKVCLCLTEICTNAKITKRSQMCHLDNTVVIWFGVILVLNEIGDSLLELAKQSVSWKQ